MVKKVAYASYLNWGLESTSPVAQIDRGLGGSKKLLGWLNPSNPRQIRPRDYCNVMYYCPQMQLNHLQHIQNAFAHAVAAPR